jgi:uncharacterized radical SAM superfamily Fe-S cluster-containing enzyme
MLGAVRGAETVTITCHPHCSLGTYLAVPRVSGRPYPITRFIDVEGMFTELNEQAARTEASRFKRLTQIGAFLKLQKFYDRSKAPQETDFMNFLKSVDGMVDKDIGRKGNTDKMLLVAGMHFMDGYNYELERVRRCVIHYATPAGRVIPFCAYNGGFTHRTTIENQFSVPVEEYRQRRGERAQGEDA